MIIFRVYWVTENVLLKLILALSFYRFNAATRKFKIASAPRVRGACWVSGGGRP